MPSSNVNAIGQGGMLEDDLASFVEHGIGTVHADNVCLRVAYCKSNCDISGATSKIYDLLSVKSGKLARKVIHEFCVWLREVSLSIRLSIECYIHQFFFGYALHVVPD